MTTICFGKHKAIITLGLPTHTCWTKHSIRQVFIRSLKDSYTRTTQNLKLN